MDQDNSNQKPRPMTPEERAKHESDFWADLLWRLETCEEAMAVFPDAYECPVCHSRREKIDGVEYLTHKKREHILN